jgi:hypothetical protein
MRFSKKARVRNVSRNWPHVQPLTLKVRGNIKIGIAQAALEVVDVQNMIRLTGIEVVVEEVVVVVRIVKHFVFVVGIGDDEEESGNQRYL